MANLEKKRNSVLLDFDINDCSKVVDIYFQAQKKDNSGTIKALDHHL